MICLKVQISNMYPLCMAATLPLVMKGAVNLGDKRTNLIAPVSKPAYRNKLLDKKKIEPKI